MIYNYLTLLLLTVPFLLVYVTFSIIYFTIVDKKQFKHIGDKEHGLSRMCLGGIFFMFGLIVFDLVFEFTTIYLHKIIINEDLMYKSDNILLDFMIENIGTNNKSFRADILVNFTIFCTAIYTGTEGLISSLKTLQVDEGIKIELPHIKRVRMSTIFYVWMFVTVISTIYTVLLGSKDVNFYLTNIYVALGSTLIILFLAERSSSVFQGKTTLIRPENNNKTANTVHVTKDIRNDKFNTNNTNDRYNNYNDSNELIGDKISINEVERLTKLDL